jgi:hypothetical protein
MLNGAVRDVRALLAVPLKFQFAISRSTTQATYMPVSKLTPW